jgi:two-component system OmpR family sensor kinase
MSLRLSAKAEMFDSIRTRLTLWYMGVLALVLILFSIGIYVLLARKLYRDLDNNLKTTIDGVTASVLREMRAGTPAAEAARESLEERVGPWQAAAIFDENGSLIAENTALNGIHAPVVAFQSVAGDAAHLFTTSERKESDQRRVIAKRVTPSPTKTYAIVVSQPLEEVNSGLETIRLILLLSIVGALALAGLGGWFLARRSLAPVVLMTERARRMSAENLTQRLPISNPHDELGHLAATFNELFGRLDESLSQQRRFMADASHELRTPLSVMRTATGVTLEQKQRSVNEYRHALKVIDQQVRRLTHIVTDMFTLARADAGRRAVNRNDFYLDELLWECVRAAEYLGSPNGVTIRLGKLPEIPYRGDEGLLRQMVLNLLDNAIKHSPPDGEVHVRLERQDSEHRIIVSDAGLGIPPEAQPHIFERFYRVDRSRSRTEASDLGAGAGLGLSIAKWIAETHHGRLELRSSDQTGSVFVASLPASEPRQKAVF